MAGQEGYLIFQKGWPITRASDHPENRSLLPEEALDQFIHYASQSIRFILLALIVVLLLSSFAAVGDSGDGTLQAPDFKATDLDGRSISLSDFRGAPLILHITNIEIPLCQECEKDLRGQVEELARLKARDPRAQILTLNMRKNPYSDDGRTLAEDWWGTNITWPWVEDQEPYSIASKYIDYWNVRGGSSNPTILLIDSMGGIAEIHHVYRVGEGEIDGIQTADALYMKLQDPGTSQRESLDGKISRQEVSAFGMFILGIVTSLAPCSIALMIAVFSYVLTVRRKDEYLRKNTSTSREGFIMGIAFTLGMGLVFFVLGLFISQVGVFLRDSRVFDLVAGIIMILLGISNIKPLGEMLSPLTSRIRRRGSDPGGIHETGDGESDGLIQRSVKTSLKLFKYSAFIGAFSLGIFFALGWAPCALSMVFPVLIWLASQNVTPLAGGTMLFIFGLGHGVPIIPIATFSRAVGGRIGDKYIALGEWTTKFFGLLVIAVGAVYSARYFGFVLW
ncbi:MAG: thiol:disulfide interchange protein precursor [Methanosaeta sp. PtaU1.Bin060]|jgi:cytochrome c-type biogenesis protein|nr:MAG: thiol:disulfide interchange protein precursor [Methanosaeta sp. PtaU1.Bin060]